MNKSWKFRKLSSDINQFKRPHRINENLRGVECRLTRLVSSPRLNLHVKMLETPRLLRDYNQQQADRKIKSKTINTFIKSTAQEIVGQSKALQVMSDNQAWSVINEAVQVQGMLQELGYKPHEINKLVKGHIKGNPDLQQIFLCQKQSIQVTRNKIKAKIRVNTMCNNSQRLFDKTLALASAKKSVMQVRKLVYLVQQFASNLEQSGLFAYKDRLETIESSIHQKQNYIFKKQKQLRVSAHCLPLLAHPCRRYLSNGEHFSGEIAKMQAKWGVMGKISKLNRQMFSSLHNLDLVKDTNSKSNNPSRIGNRPSLMQSCPKTQEQRGRSYKLS